MVHSHKIEQAPIHCFPYQCGVADLSVKFLPHLFICFFQESIQRRIVFAGFGVLPKGWVAHALGDIPARHDPLHEQRQLGAYQQDQLPGPSDAQPFRRPGHPGDICQCFRLALIPHLGRQPHLQTQL